LFNRDHEEKGGGGGKVTSSLKKKRGGGPLDLLNERKKGRVKGEKRKKRTSYLPVLTS